MNSMCERTNQVLCDTHGLRFSSVVEGGRMGADVDVNVCGTIMDFYDGIHMFALPANYESVWMRGRSWFFPPHSHVDCAGADRFVAAKKLLPVGIYGQRRWTRQISMHTMRTYNAEKNTIPAVLIVVLWWPQPAVRSSSGCRLVLKNFSQ